MSVRTALILAVPMTLAGIAFAVTANLVKEARQPVPAAKPVTQAELDAVDAVSAALDACARDLKAARESDPAIELDAAYLVGIGDRVVIEDRHVTDGYRRYRRGDDCRIDPGGIMTVLDVRRAGDGLGHWIEYLVRYARPPKTSENYVAPEHDAKPYLCPDGATFYHEDPLFIAEDPRPIRTAEHP